MKMTAAQNQRQIDRASDIDLMAEHIEQEMREELLAGRYYEIEYRDGLRIVKTVYDEDNVVDDMIELDATGFNQAVMMTAKDPIEAAKILTGLMHRAVEQILGRAKIREDAEYRIEISGRDAA